MNTTALEVAISKARSLPDAAREQIGRDVLLRIERLEKLRGDLQIGIDELEAGKGETIAMDDLKAEARQQHGEEA
jgi:hypothetical protein